MTTINYKSKFLTAAVVFLATVLVIAGIAGIMGAFPSNAETDQTNRNTINVTGNGKVSASPDIAYISLGVVTEDKVANTAQQNNAKAMDQIISKIKGLGIAAEDIKTVGYNIYPKYDYIKDTGESNITGYTVNNTVQVTVRDIKKTGNVIDVASANGANITNGISFGLSDYEKYYNQALKSAVTAAKKRAETIAGALSINLKKPVTVTENGGSAPVYNYRSYDLKADAASVATPVEAGTIEVSASVSMVYEY